MNRFSLFEAYGIELEYMIVDRDSLQVRPLADSLLCLLAGGRAVSDVDLGSIGISNELALHVVELKTGQPRSGLFELAAPFCQCIRSLAPFLERLHARLLPTGMHPLMDPRRELVLWPHENHEIYGAYDRLFDCRRHGWANVQSVHLNLPFGDEEQFRRLHAAIRVVLPLLPALAASSPIAEGRLSRCADLRLHHYVHHCDAYPSLIGDVIPDAFEDQRSYEQQIYRPIREQIRPLDPDGVFEVDFLNARGAIARFDRGSIEIRVLDTQETPSADLAICAAVIALLKRLMMPPDAADRQNRIGTPRLRSILDDVIREGENATIRDAGFLERFGCDTQEITAGALWATLLPALRLDSADVDRLWQPLQLILDQGTLSTRIRQQLGTDPTEQRIVAVYRKLADCLASGDSFTV